MTKYNSLSYVRKVIQAIHCDPITVKGAHLTVRVEGTKLGHSAIFQCPKGYWVSGSTNLTCQASGED
ncbi:hypothetical protein HHI36_018058 [Cryptolaemus montrouzieri]|uniref:Sushi domain-containing protein n=1 Tax=Cryptolaemus montrouzieri TaxID=559131 RepID=A0ABD2NZ47_9CUCU